MHNLYSGNALHNNEHQPQHFWVSGTFGGKPPKHTDASTDFRVYIVRVFSHVLAVTP